MNNNTKAMILVDSPSEPSTCGTRDTLLLKHVDGTECFFMVLILCPLELSAFRQEIVVAGFRQSLWQINNAHKSGYMFTIPSFFESGLRLCTGKSGNVCSRPPSLPQMMFVGNGGRAAA
jgi:hypothetical protein